MRCPKCNSENVGVHDRNVSPHRTRMRCNDCKHRWNVSDSEVGEVSIPKVTVSKPVVLHQKALTANQLLKIHDMKTKVLDVFKSIPDTSEGVFFERGQIAKMVGCSVNNDDFKSAINSHDLRGYSAITLDGKMTYYSHPSTIARYSKGENQIFRS